MKKIGIATITFTKNRNVDFNYGNILQNYALHTYLLSQNYETETIYYTPSYFQSDNQQTSKNHREWNGFRQFFDDLVRVAKRKIFSSKLKEKKSNRRIKINKFIENNIKYSNNCYDANSDLDNLNNLYDYFITGSDQVWNPYYEGSNSFFYLQFAERRKRISYAPSIAVNKIPDEMEDNYTKWVKSIDCLSIREVAGQKLLKERFEVNAQLVCDPVFLLDIDKWNKLARNINMDKKYFAVYILGKKSIVIKNAILQLEKITGFKSVDIYTNDDLKSGFFGIEEFLGCIKDSEFIFTNSFHGAAFSTIFNRPMVITERDSCQKMNSRIDNLLELLGIGNRNVDYILQDIKRLSINNYSQNDNLNNLISSSKEFLCRSLSNGR